MTIETCEADDIIATLVQKYSATQKIMILSSDKDFAQLQRYPNVEQYSPILKKFINEPLPMAQLKQMVIRGDKGDGIPNILSGDNCIVSGERQTPITQKKIDAWLKDAENLQGVMDTETYRNYQRNLQLIDLSKTPQEIKDSIINTFEIGRAHV